MKTATRKVVTRSPGRTVRLVNLPHLQPEPIETESTPERDFVHIAALFPRIRSIKHQPFKLELSSGSYTPDFLLTFLDASRSVVEVKGEAFLPREPRTLAEAENLLASHDMSFLLALDTQIQREGRADRALRIRRYGKSRIDEAVATTALAQLLEQVQMTVGELMAGGVDLVTIAHLVSKRQIEVVSDLRLEHDSTLRCVSKTNKGESDAVRFGRWFANSPWPSDPSTGA